MKLEYAFLPDIEKWKSKGTKRKFKDFTERQQVMLHILCDEYKEPLGQYKWPVQIVTREHLEWFFGCKIEELPKYYPECAEKFITKYMLEEVLKNDKNFATQYLGTLIPSLAVTGSGKGKETHVMKIELAEVNKDEVK